MSSLADLKVGLILNSGRMGGSERQALLLAHALRGEGLSPKLLGLSGEGPLHTLSREQGIETETVELRYPLSPWYFPLNALRALRFLRRQSPDILLGFTSVPNLYGGILWKATGAKVFVWGQRNAGLDRPPPFLERLALRRSSAWISNAPSGVDFLEQTLGLAPDKIHLIPNGVELPAQPVSLSGKHHGVCLANGRLEKDHATLLRAWAKVCDHPDIRDPMLHLAGHFDPGASLTTSLRDACGALGITDKVRFCGAVEHPIEVFQMASLGLLSSTTEGMPNAVLEYMAAGLPVVASDLPGIRAVLEPLQQNNLFPPGDADSLAEKILARFFDPTRSAKEGAANRARVAEHHSVKTLAAKTLDVVRASLDGGTR